MDLQSRKLLLIQEFLNLQSEELISRIENILKSKKMEEPFYPMTMENFNKRIDSSLEDSKNGKLTNVNTLLNEIEEW